MSAAQAGDVVYEVNLDVEAAIEADYRAWLRGHIDDILALPGFLDARVFDVIDPPPAPGRIALCVQYRMHDEAALQDYFDQHAPRLRGDGIARFGGRFNASRRVLRAVAA
ncbi:DUF4286 family protein [Thermomonas sp. HDW16]|uniref:DUF4286 family protein n=1 Tax=Thermomonas sp. HDW16 TaxID=2714945 RepID=UPI0014086466|nr:DUF4286 family protein [Thermomonas sp. HDW16]QIL19330.1 DUF4286 family protein [Thermomonas sp. HDW16]